MPSSVQKGVGRVGKGVHCTCSHYLHKVVAFRCTTLTFVARGRLQVGFQKDREFLQFSNDFMLSQFLKLEIDSAGVFNRRSPFCIPYDTNLTLLLCISLIMVNGQSSFAAQKHVTET